MATNHTHVAWIHATNQREADALIDTVLDYAHDTWSIETQPTTRDALKTYLNKNTLATIHADSMIVGVTRLDDTDRDGPDALGYAGKQLPSPTVDHIIVPSMANLQTEHVTDALRHGVDVHTPDTGIIIRGGGEPEPAVKQAVRTLCGDARDADTLIEGIPHRGGRPPIGTRVERGYLRAGEDYHNVCRVLQDVRDGDMSKVDAADAIGCARKTIDNALNRDQLYRLD